MWGIRDRLPAKQKKDRSHLCFAPATSWKEKAEHGAPLWHHRPASPQSTLFSAPQWSKTWTANTTQSTGIFHACGFMHCFEQTHPAERMCLIWDQQGWSKEGLNYGSLKNDLYFSSVWWPERHTTKTCLLLLLLQYFSWFRPSHMANLLIWHNKVFS